MNTKEKNSKLVFLMFCVFYIFLAGLNVIFAFFLQSILDAAAEKNAEALKTAVLQAVILTVLEFIAACISKFMGLSYVEIMLGKIKNNRLWFLFQGKNRKGSEDAKKCLANFTTDIDLLNNQYYTNKALIVYSIAQFVFSLVAIISINWILSIIIITVSLLPFIIPSLFQKYVQRTTEKFSKTTADYIDFVNECLIGELEILSYGKESEVFEKHKLKNKEIERMRKKSRMAASLAGVMSNSLGTVTFLTVISFASYFVMTGRMTFGYMIAVIQLMNGLLGPVSQLISYLTEMSSVKGIRAEMSKKHEETNDVMININGFQDVIKISGLSFTYDNDPENRIFNGLDLKLEKGKKYALLGPSGSGKSTLARILAGEISAYEGTVTLDGRDIQSITPSNYKGVVRYLRQQPFLFNDSIKLNITFYDKLETEDQQNRLRTDISLSDVNEFVSSQDELSRKITNVTGISGGQKQRIALARALYHNYDVLILDEATSGLDLDQSQKIITNIFQKFDDKTFIVITHDYDESFLSLFDEIITLNKHKTAQEL